MKNIKEILNNFYQYFFLQWKNGSYMKCKVELFRRIKQEAIGKNAN